MPGFAGARLYSSHAQDKGASEELVSCACFVFHNLKATIVVKTGYRSPLPGSLYKH